MAQFHTDEYVEFLSRVTPDLVEAAAEGGGGGRTGGIGREMGKCELRRAWLDEGGTLADLRIRSQRWRRLPGV